MNPPSTDTPFSKDPELQPQLIRTWLSKKPQPGSFMITVFTFLIMGLMSQVFWVDFLGLAKLLPASHDAVFTHYQFWRLFTAIFIHADMEHFLSNMYMLMIFSYFVYGYTNRWIYPFLSYLLAGFVNAMAVYTYPAQTQLLGASGLVYLLAGCWLSLFFFIQRQYSITHRLLRLLGIAIVILFPTSFSPTTSYRTHFFGFIVGVILGIFYFLSYKNILRAEEKYKISDFTSDTSG